MNNWIGSIVIECCHAECGAERVPISAVVISTSLYHLGGYEPSSPTTKDLHGVGVQGKYFVVV